MKPLLATLFFIGCISIYAQTPRPTGLRVTVAGKDTGFVTRAELENTNRLVVASGSGSVESFKFSTFSRKKIKGDQSNLYSRDSLTQSMKNWIRQLQVGDILYFDHIRVRMPDGNLRKAPSIRLQLSDTTYVEQPKIFTLRNVHFETGKSFLRPESFSALGDLAEMMKTNRKMVVEIAGHTDNIGDNTANQKLSQERAESVRAWLISKGIAQERITAKGYGEAEPAASNETEEGRKANRRTEVRILTD